MSIHALYAEISHDNFHFVLEDSLYSIQRHLTPHGMHVLGLSIDNWHDVDGWDEDEFDSRDAASDRRSSYDQIRRYMLERSTTEFVTVECYVYGQADSPGELQARIADILNFAHCRFEPIGDRRWKARGEYTFAYDEPDPVQTISNIAQQVGMTFEVVEVTRQVEIDLDPDVLDELLCLELPGVPSEGMDRMLPTVICEIAGTARKSSEFIAALRDLLHDGCLQVSSIKPIGR